MKKFYLATVLMAIIFVGCLKQSIPDAMLGAKNSGKHATTATLNYKINGTAVNLSVADADNQAAGNYTLSCNKYPGYFGLDAVTNSGEFTFLFYTDSLTVGNYKYIGTYGDMFFIDYNNTAEFVHDPSDSMSFNITSYSNGHISGNFSGVLTPLVTGSTINNIYGISSSVFITEGSFQNVPIFY